MIEIRWSLPPKDPRICGLLGSTLPIIWLTLIIVLNMKTDHKNLTKHHKLHHLTSRHRNIGTIFLADWRAQLVYSFSEFVHLLCFSLSFLVLPPLFSPLCRVLGAPVQNLGRTPFMEFLRCNMRRKLGKNLVHNLKARWLCPNIQFVIHQEVGNHNKLDLYVTIWPYAGQKTLISTRPVFWTYKKTGSPLRT